MDEWIFSLTDQPTMDVPNFIMAVTPPERVCPFSKLRRQSAERREDGFVQENSDEGTLQPGGWRRTTGEFISGSFLNPFVIMLPGEHSGPGAELWALKTGPKSEQG